MTDFSAYATCQDTNNCGADSGVASVFPDISRTHGLHAPCAQALSSHVSGMTNSAANRMNATMWIMTIVQATVVTTMGRFIRLT